MPLHRALYMALHRALHRAREQIKPLKSAVQKVPLTEDKTKLMDIKDTSVVLMAWPREGCSAILQQDGGRGSKRRGAVTDAIEEPGEETGISPHPPCRG